MPFRIQLDANGSIHGPIEVPEGFLADVPEPTAVEVAAEFTRRLAEDHRTVVGAGAPDFAFRPPLTIVVEEVEAS